MTYTELKQQIGKVLTYNSAGSTNGKKFIITKVGDKTCTLTPENVSKFNAAFKISTWDLQLAIEAGYYSF